MSILVACCEIISFSKQFNAIEINYLTRIVKKAVFCLTGRRSTYYNKAILGVIFSSCLLLSNKKIIERSPESATI